MRCRQSQVYEEVMTSQDRADLHSKPYPLLREESHILAQGTDQVVQKKA